MNNKPIRIDKVKQRRGALGGIKTSIKLVLLVIIALVTLVSVTHTMDSIAEIEAQMASVQAQIAQAEARRREIEDSAAYVASVSFIEYIARNRLGLVHRDEIIFMMIYE